MEPAAAPGLATGGVIASIANGRKNAVGSTPLY